MKKFNRRNPADGTKFKTNLHEDHSKPLSRREFLAQTAMASCTSFIIPSFTGLLANVVQAQTAGANCTLPVGSNRMAFFVFDEAGGGNIAGNNVMVGKTAQKDYLSNYLRLGLPDELNPANRPDMVDEQFGLAFHKDSPFLEGMLMGASQDVRDRCDGIVICAASSNDTRNNPHNPSTYIAKSGTVGSLAPAAGSSNSDTGGNSTGYTNPQFKQVLINNPDAATALVDPGRMAQQFAAYANSQDAKVKDQFGRDIALKASNAISSLSAGSLAKISDNDMPAIIRNLATCGYVNVPGTMNKFSKDVVDARLDPTFYTVNAANPNGGMPFGLANSNDDHKRVATMAKLALSGYTGPCTFSRGGFDYHNNDRRVGNGGGGAYNIGGGQNGQGTDDSDFFMGLMIGKTLQAAHDVSKPCFIYCFSDGSVTSTKDLNGLQNTRGRVDANGVAKVVQKFMWTGDCEECASVFLLAYRPGPTRAVKPILTQKFRQSHQIGAFQIDGGGNPSVDRKATIVSDNVQQLAELVVLNYLAAHGEIGRMVEVVGENPFQGKEDSFVAFEKLV